MRTHPVRGLTVLLVACLVVGGVVGLVIAHAREPKAQTVPANRAPAAQPVAGVRTIDADAVAPPLAPLAVHPVAGPDVFLLHAATMRARATGSSARLTFDQVASALIGVTNGKQRTSTRTKLADFVRKWAGSARASLTVDGVPAGSGTFTVNAPAYDAGHASLQFGATHLDAASRAWLTAQNGAHEVTLFLDVTPDCGASVAPSCAYALLRGHQLAGHNFSDVDLYRAQLTAANLAGANFTHAWIGGADFSFASAPRARFVGMNPQLTSSTETRFDGAVLTPGVTMSGDLQGASFAGARMQGATLAAASLGSARFVAADLAGADLSNSDLTGATFEEADLTGANLTGADLTGAHFENAILHGATLTHADLTNATFAHADLSDATLVDATMIGTQLPDATLTGARLGGATMFGADLWHTSFSGAEMPAFATPIASLGPQWKAAAAYFPTVLDMAGYTCGTQWPGGTFDFADCQYEPGALATIAGSAADAVNEQRPDMTAQPNAALRAELEALLRE